MFFRDRVSLYSSGCPGTHFVDQAGLELRNLPASASQMLGLKACATTAWLNTIVFIVAFNLFSDYVLLTLKSLNMLACAYLFLLILFLFVFVFSRQGFSL